MDYALLRERLHEYINMADDNHLSAIYTLFGDKDPDVKHDDIYDEATMDMLYKRRENYRKGLSKSHTVEESMDLVRRYKK